MSLKKNNPGCNCCCTEPPSCTLTGLVSGGVLILTWTVTGTGISSAVITSTAGGSWTLTVPPNTGSITTETSTCNTFTLTVTSACGTSTCTYVQSNCVVENESTPDPCIKCVESDFPSSSRLPRQVKITIANVGDGTPGTYPAPPLFPPPTGSPCAYYNNSPSFISNYYTSSLTNPSCEANLFANHKAFFNGDFTLDPCTTVNLWECIYKCSTGDVSVAPFPGSNRDYVEYNSLHLSYTYGSGTWNVAAELNSHIVFSSVGTAGNGCSTMPQFPDKRLQGPQSVTNTYAWLSWRRKIFSFSLPAGLHVGYKYYEPACPEVCNQEISLIKCLASGVAFDPNSPFITAYDCKKALDVESATASCVVL